MIQSQGAGNTAGPTPEEVAWAAGLFDGEGTFGLSRRWKGTGPGYTQDRFYARASLEMADDESIERFHKVVSVGAVCSCKVRESHHRPMRKWEIEAKAAVVHVIDLLAPYLSSEKLVKAMNVLAADSRA